MSSIIGSIFLIVVLSIGIVWAYAEGYTSYDMALVKKYYRHLEGDEKINNIYKACDQSTMDSLKTKINNEHMLMKFVLLYHIPYKDLTDKDEPFALVEDLVRLCENMPPPSSA